MPSQDQRRPGKGLWGDGDRQAADEFGLGGKGSRQGSSGAYPYPVTVDTLMSSPSVDQARNGYAALMAAASSSLAPAHSGQMQLRRSARNRSPTDGGAGDTPSSSTCSLPDLEKANGRVQRSSGGGSVKSGGGKRGRPKQRNHWVAARQLLDETVDSDAEEAATRRAGSSRGGQGPSVWEEKWQLALLVLLYMMQGIPMGLAVGAMPFMLQHRLSYSQIGTFSLAAYPYSFKLLWSPIVDSLYSPRMGRRKTWIIPIQFCTAGLLFFGARTITALYEAADVTSLTALFLVIVFLAATQDIAVDGWALTLLSPHNVGWASTSQTIGGSTGFFTSFTVFLALQDVKFCNAYVRSWRWAQVVFGADPTATEPLVTLPGYLRFWGAFFALVTALLWAFQTERGTEEERRQQDAAAKLRAIQGCSPLQSVVAEVKAAYAGLWGVAKLRAIWGLVALLLTYRLSVLVSEGAASLKLIDKGVPKESLAALVLLQFPIELVTAVFAGRWAAASSPAPPFLASYFMRLVVNAAFVAVVALYPAGGFSTVAGEQLFGVYVVVSLVGSCVSTLAFTSLGSLFNAISDPDMGGAYLTLLNTIANMGVILPKAPFFYLIDLLTRVTCVPSSHDTTQWDDGGGPAPEELERLWCPKKASELATENPCTLAGGECVMVRDGFYAVCWTCLTTGLLLGVLYLRYLPALIRLPISAWRAEGTSSGGSAKSRRVKA